MFKLRINIISVNGKRIRQIANKSYPEGNILFQWDGRTESGKLASSGQYFIVVEGDNFQRWINTTMLK